MEGRGTSGKSIGDHSHIVTTSGFFLLGGIQALGVAGWTHGRRGRGAYEGNGGGEHGAEQLSLAACSVVDGGYRWCGRGEREEVKW